MIGAAGLLKKYPDRAWYTTDPAGNVHVFVQSESPGSTALHVCTINYDFQHVDSLVQRKLARLVGGAFDSREIEERPHPGDF